MSNISRRDFLKTAGVMTLAVAAAGVLAGCEGSTVPAPEAGKPEVKPSSVSYTGYNDDKLTVESMGRFHVYANHDADKPASQETVLKLTYTKPEYSTEASITSVTIKTESDQAVTDKATASDFAKAKFGLTTANQEDATSITKVFTVAAGTRETTTYAVLDVTNVKTNNLKVVVEYTDKDGRGETLTMPLSVTQSDVY